MFQLPFEIMTNDKLEAARTGNWFSETPLAIARLDQLARNEKVQALLRTREDGWDFPRGLGLQQSCPELA